MKRAEQLQLRRLLRQQLFALKGRRSIGRHNRTGLGLIQRVYGQYDLASRPQNAPSADALWRRTDAINGQAAPGDILFFTGDHQTPSLGIARRVLDNGVIEFATYQGGRVQFLRCDPKHPDTRRSRGHILNSFIRTKKPSDRPRSRYLAGQYLVGIRTPFK